MYPKRKQKKCKPRPPVRLRFIRGQSTLSLRSRHKHYCWLGAICPASATTCRASPLRYAPKRSSQPPQHNSQPSAPYSFPDFSPIAAAPLGCTSRFAAWVSPRLVKPHPLPYRSLMAPFRVHCPLLAACTQACIFFRFGQAYSTCAARLASLPTALNGASSALRG